MRYFNPAGTYAGHMTDGTPVRVERQQEVEFTPEEFASLPPRLQARLVEVDEEGVVQVTKPAAFKDSLRPPAKKGNGKGKGSKGADPLAAAAANSAAAAGDAAGSATGA